MPAVPVYQPDLFSDEAVLQPRPHYAAMRDLGPVVRLGDSDLLAVTRYDDVRAVLGDDQTFRSGEGVLFSDAANQLTRGTTLASDAPLHDLLRRVVAHRLTPRALRDQTERVEAIAARVVETALRDQEQHGWLDVVPQVAQALPLAVVPDYLGFPNDARDHLLRWSFGAIEAGGPPHERSAGAVDVARELGAYAADLVRDRRLLPGSLGADVIAAADRGEITPDQCVPLLLDYFGPSLETTISAIGSALALFADHPDQWALLREEPDLVGGAFNEVVRLESPLRAFTRVAASETTISGVPVPAGTRVAVFYASANLDERKWEDPERFDIARRNSDQLGVGYGAHGCAGQGLARLEFRSLFTALAGRVSRFEHAGEPVRVRSSLVRAWASLPLRLVPDGATSGEAG